MDLDIDKLLASLEQAQAALEEVRAMLPASKGQSAEKAQMDLEEGSEDAEMQESEESAKAPGDGSGKELSRTLLIRKMSME